MEMLPQDTAPGLSTGKATEYTALEGAFSGAPAFTNNLAQTLDGVWDATVFTYNDYAATEALFFDWFIAEPTIAPLPDNPYILSSGPWLRAKPSPSCWPDPRTRTSTSSILTRDPAGCLISR